MSKPKEQTKEQQFQVMMVWKKTYTESIIDHLSPIGDVLEIGFGIGWAADRIQSFKPSSHTIIESDLQSAKEAKDWAKKYPNVKIIQDSWQNALPALDTFDAIFFNDYPLGYELEMMRFLCPEEVKIASDQAKELLTLLEEHLAQVKVKYSDHEIDKFYEQIGQNNLNELPHFFGKLKEKGHITSKQYQHAMQKYQLGKTEQKSKDSMFIFLEAAQKHMKKGARFSCFLIDPTSKYEDAQFFDGIITNPDFNYHEELIPINIPNFKFKEALVMIVEKL